MAAPAPCLLRRSTARQVSHTAGIMPVTSRVRTGSEVRASRSWLYTSRGNIAVCDDGSPFAMAVGFANLATLL